MANEKELPIKCILSSEPLCCAEQRNVTQTDGLLSNIIKNSCLYGFSVTCARFMMKKDLPERSRVTVRAPRLFWRELETMCLAD